MSDNKVVAVGWLVAAVIAFAYGNKELAYTAIICTQIWAAA